MNLKLSTPKGEENATFSIPYDLNTRTKKVNGHCVITDNEIRIYLDDDITEKYPLDYFDEYICEQLIGCSMLVGRKGDQRKFLCAFTQTYFIRYAELCKILEFYKRTGELFADDDQSEPSCTKCGLPLDSETICPFCAKKSEVFLKLIKRAKPYKWLFALALLCTILTEVIWIIQPRLQRTIIDDFVIPRNKDLHSFLIICGMLVGIILLAWIFEVVNMKASFKMALSIGKDLRQEVFAKVQKLSMSSVSKRTTGGLIRRVSNDAMKLQEFISQNGKELIVRLFSVTMLSILIFVMNPKLALFVLAPIPIVIFFNVKLFNVMSIRYGRVWRMSTRHSTVLHDTLNGIRVVKSYGTEKYAIDQHEKASMNWAKSIRNADIVWLLTMPFSRYILSIGSYLVLLIGGSMVLDQTLTLGQLVQYTTYVAMIYGPLGWLIELPRILADTTVSVSRVFEILDEDTDVADSENALDIDIKGDITFDDVYFGYKVYNPVLKGISCEIKQGEMIGIVGHSGVGKSTMINLILRLYDCTQGRILIDGIDIRNLSQDSLRTQVGVVLQETFLFDGSVYDNIRYAKEDSSFEEIISAAKIANAHDFIVKLPEGYNTRVGDKGYSLSGGERQRIAIARAILHDPKILILDEATASLDTQTERNIQEALSRLIEGRTTIAIAHRLSTLSNADKLIVLDKGRLAEMGPHEELMRNGGVYYKLVMAQRQTTKMKEVID
ncbi:MAG: ABC transporter ATP-binding protein [Clostridiales bacterium]|nr:ABC transporter ATP-binding protein [Clostridiales bacterium]